MTVATALAVSWNPLTNSKLNARNSAKSKNIPAPTVTGSPKSCTMTRLREGRYNIMNKSRELEKIRLPIRDRSIGPIVQDPIRNRLGDLRDHFQRPQVQFDAQAGPLVRPQLAVLEIRVQWQIR